MAVARFGISLEEELLEALDKYVSDNQFPNRSQAIRFLIEKNLVEEKWKCNHTVAGAIILVYDPNHRETKVKISDIILKNREDILSVQQFFTEKDLCMEIIAVSGASYKLTELSEILIAVKGIKRGKLVMSRIE
ncbi:nickel-responsive transcriptional regulator NikR [Porphyromonadaceae bacterium]